MGRLHVFAYHGVPNPDLFRSQAIQLLRWFRPVGLEEVVGGAHAISRRDRPCWVTFDDGSPSVPRHAMEILAELQIPATIFVCPGVVGSASPYWWHIIEEAARFQITVEGRPITQSTVTELKATPDYVRRKFVAAAQIKLEDIGWRCEVEQMTLADLAAWRDAGHTIGNHTWDHPVLDTATDVEQRNQIEEAHVWLQNHFPQDHFAFAYPNGNSTNFARSVLLRLGYRVAVLFDHRVDRQLDPLCTSRIRVNGSDPTFEFRARISGLHPALHHVLGRD